MSAKFFDKKLKHSCAWCRYGKKSDYTDDIFCLKRGVTGRFDSCRHYKYDPLKRIPENAKLSGNYTAEDFEI